MTRIYVSHGAGSGQAGNPDDCNWFIVEARGRSMKEELRSLLAAHRTVIALDAEPFTGRAFRVRVRVRVRVPEAAEEGEEKR